MHRPERRLLIIENASLLVGIFLVPAGMIAAGLKLTGRAVRWVPLVWALFAYLLYVTLLKSRVVLPVPALLQDLPLIWFGKLLSLSGTIALLYLIPTVNYREAGLTWLQHKGSLAPVAIAAGMTIGCAATTSLLFTYSPNVTLENLLFQATLPGIDEELFMRGLLLLLLHQAFAKDLTIFGSETGWGFWVVVVIFALLHGLDVNDTGAVSVNVGAILSTGFTGFILTWMRERTGSLVVPILFHNTFNVVMAFV